MKYCWASHPDQNISKLNVACAMHVLLVLHDGMNPSSNGSKTGHAANLIGALPSLRHRPAFVFAHPCTKCEFDHVEIIGLIVEVPR